MENVVILSAVRTAIGSFLGNWKDIPAPKLAASAIEEAVKKAAIPVEKIDECLLGCVLSSGLGQAPARQAVIFSGLPHSIRATTINRVCASGMKSIMLASQIIQSGDGEILIAGGMENMSRAPYLMDRAREGFRLGHGKIIDSLIGDGLWDVYNNIHMGDCAELCAKEKDISRKEQDEYARTSYERALESVTSGKFKNEIVPIEITTGKEKKRIDLDEEPFKAKLEKFPELRPAFQKEGTITAANASSLSDGAAIVVLSSKEAAKKWGSKPMARIVAQASHAQAPEWFTTAPVGAIQTLLKKAKLPVSEVDLFEINEAFSVVSLACNKELGLSPQKVNIRGGAVALGHPIGASGARIVVTLLHNLIAEKKKWGVAAICNGGGEASAVLIENLIL